LTKGGTDGEKAELEGGNPESAGATPIADVTAPAEGGTAMGGMWGDTAMNMLKQRLADTRERASPRDSMLARSRLS